MANSNFIKIPESVMTANRIESDLTLKVTEGSVPDDIHGHAFIVAPVGSINANGLPHADGTPVFNGDGMIYRLDFEQAGVRLKTRLIKPPCYYADKVTQPGTDYEKYRFINFGFARFSPALGLRNELNTAFVPMQFAGEANERLLVGYDAGRPYEIDTETLEAVTPVGWNKEWKSEAPINFPFPAFLGTAHPTFDPFTEELFTVNYGRSLVNFLETIPLFYEVGEVPEEIEDFLIRVSEVLSQSFVRRLKGLKRLGFAIWQKIARLSNKLLGTDSQDFLYLIRWDGRGELERWRLILPDGSPVRIEQAVHQIAVCEDYVIVMDTSLRFGLEQVLNSPFPRSKGVERLLRLLLTRPQLPDTTFYIVRREDLKNGQCPMQGDSEVTAVAQKVVLPLEIVHFLVDYTNREGQITLHAGHTCTLDGSEWLRTFDRSAYDPHDGVPKHLHGMLNDSLDINRVGRYVIDAASGNILQSQVLYDTRYSWGLGVCTYRDRLPDGLPPKQIEDIYWAGMGLWPELLTQFACNLYDDYKYRVIPIETLQNLANPGQPSALFRVHVEQQGITIADGYAFPEGHLVNSPQFVPRKGTQGGATDGYIVCTVLSDNNEDIWIFAADNLTQGPLCKLNHPTLNFSFTVHTAWLPQIARRTASYSVPVQEDYKDSLEQMNPKRQKTQDIQRIFEQDIYPHFRE